MSNEEPPPKRQRKDSGSHNDDHVASNDSEAYIDTINRNKIDFDFEKICLVSLSKSNVYCCLVCGKYFQGRSVSSPAYNHSIEWNHHVFMNLQTHKTYILPEDYQVTSPKALKHLQDIIYLLNPTYSQQDVARLDTEPSPYDLTHKPYFVGYIGLNKISKNDYSNVIVQALAHIQPIRDFLLLLPNDSLYEVLEHKYPLVSMFGLMVRKIWSRHLFKPHVSPHEFLQLVSLMSKKSFSITHQSSPKHFMVWFLNQLHSQLTRAIGKKRTILSKTLQGEIIVTTIPVVQKQASDSTVQFERQESMKKISILKFWHLSLSLGPASALKIQDTNDTVPQVSIELLLLKYDGTTTSQASASELRTYKLKYPGPPFLIMHIDRNLEEGNIRGNPTVVKFPMVLDMAPYIEGEIGPQKYQLVSSIKHHYVAGDTIDHKHDKQQWSISLLADSHKSEWVHIQDLDVTKVDGEFLFLDETYIQVWKRMESSHVLGD